MHSQSLSHNETLVLFDISHRTQSDENVLTVAKAPTIANAIRQPRMPPNHSSYTLFQRRASSVVPVLAKYSHCRHLDPAHGRSYPRDR